MYTFSIFYTTCHPFIQWLTWPLSLAIKQLRYESWHTIPPSNRAKNKLRHSLPPLRLHGLHRHNIKLLLLVINSETTTTISRILSSFIHHIHYYVFRPVTTAILGWCYICRKGNNCCRGLSFTIKIQVYSFIIIPTDGIIKFISIKLLK